MGFHFRLIPEKCNGNNFQKLQKTPIWSHFWPFLPMSLEKIFFPSIFSSHIKKSYIPVKTLKKTNEPFLKKTVNRQTDRQTDRQTGRQAGRLTDRQTDRQKDIFR